MSDRPDPEFIIWCGSFDDKVGGIIALYELCQRLDEVGSSAMIWPDRKPLTLAGSSFRSLATYFLKVGPFRRRLGPHGARVASRRHLSRAILIYPEVVAGNPLGGRNVVRWLLHKPGYQTGKAEYGDEDLFFCHNPAFNDATRNPEGKILRVTLVNEAYRQTNFGPRSGAAFLVRKGSRRDQDAHPADAVNVDNLSHAERAAVFNRVRYLYSYDPYSFLVVYAALCGCTPIVIPEPGISEEAWQPNVERRLGIAYGKDRIAWAEATREDLRDSIARSRAHENEIVRNFVRVCRDRFGAL
jgi:hypothetical protein